MKDRLKSAILSAISKQPQREEIRYLAGFCHRIAYTYLKRRARSGKLDPNFFGLTLEDLALDCIADLFQRDDSGEFVQLVAYYEPLYPCDKTGPSLLAATRRLVFSQVGEGLFRRYREADPALAKTIRNLRNAVDRAPGVYETRRQRALWVTFGDYDGTSAPRPIMPPEFLEARLMEYPIASSDLKDVLLQVRYILSEHPVYRQAYPLTELAIIVRSAHERLAATPQPNWVAMNRLHARDIRYFINRSLRSVKEEMRTKYVAGGKMDADTFNAYFDAAGEVLEAQCVTDDLENDSYYEHLSARVSTLSYNGYRHDHRARFEYIVKKTRERFLSKISRHWG